MQKNTLTSGKSAIGQKNFNRLTRQNTTAKLSQVLVEKKLQGDLKGYDTIKKRYDVTQQDAMKKLVS